MKQDKKIREPRQKRSEATIENILSTALTLFCQKGYYKTSTNEIAKDANISIGNLYFYFPDKETIFLEILDRYHQSFLKIHKAFLNEIEDSDGNLKAFLRKIIEEIIKNHEVSKELNREIQILSFSNPKVRNVLEQQQEHIENSVLLYLQKYKDKIQVRDLEAAAAVIFALMNAVVDKIVFSKNSIDRERLLIETVNAVEAYLLKGTQ